MTLSAGQREGERSGSYRVIFLSNDKEYKYSSNLELFNEQEPGSKWKLYVNKLGALTRIEK